MSQELPEFDDPELKTALKRTAGKECAPHALRQRIEALAIHAGSGAAEAVPTRLAVWRRPAFRVAAAMLLALTGVYAILVYRTGPTAQLPESLLLAMAERHDGCCTHDHRQGDLPQNDLRLLGQAMASRLGIRVLSFDLSKEGWNFSGGALCPINGHKSGHLVFAGNEGHLSVFSVPPAGSGGAINGEIVVRHAKSHEIAAFVQGGAVYAIVHEGPHPIADAKLRQMLRDHREQIVAAAVAMGIAPKPIDVR